MDEKRLQRVAEDQPLNPRDCIIDLFEQLEDSKLRQVLKIEFKRLLNDHDRLVNILQQRSEMLENDNDSLKATIDAMQQRYEKAVREMQFFRKKYEKVASELNTATSSMIPSRSTGSELSSDHHQHHHHQQQQHPSYPYPHHHHPQQSTSTPSSITSPLSPPTPSTLPPPSPMHSHHSHSSSSHSHHHHLQHHQINENEVYDPITSADFMRQKSLTNRSVSTASSYAPSQWSSSVATSASSTISECPPLPPPPTTTNANLSLSSSMTTSNNSNSINNNNNSPIRVRTRQNSNATQASAYSSNTTNSSDNQSIYSNGQKSDQGSKHQSVYSNGSGKLLKNHK